MSEELYLGDRVYWDGRKGGIRHGGLQVSITSPLKPPGMKQPPIYVDFAAGVFPGEIQETAVHRKREMTRDEQKWFSKLCARLFGEIDKLLKDSEKW
jgi:hypothetical protein